MAAAILLLIQPGVSSSQSPPSNPAVIKALLMAGDNSGGDEGDTPEDSDTVYRNLGEIDCGTCHKTSLPRSTFNLEKHKKRSPELFRIEQ